MPEEPEVETERLHEVIHEELEKEGSSFLKKIALTTAMLAALAAVATHRAGDTQNEAHVFKTEAGRLQAEASDQWAFYQAKGIKAAVEKASQAVWLAQGKPVPEASEATVHRYEEEQTEIKAKASEKEKERDERSLESDELLHHHHRFANAVALFQVSIALGAVAALTRNRLVWFGSMGVGLCGTALFLATVAM
jgi:hypothetical protein